MVATYSCFMVAGAWLVIDLGFASQSIPFWQVMHQLIAGK